MKGLFKVGGGALAASGILFALVALLDFRTGPPPSTGAEILLWRDSQAFVLSFVSEFLFFATILLIPGTIALYQSLVDIDKTTPETATLVVMVFYGGLHVIYLLFAAATIVLSLAMTRGAYTKWIAYFGFATAALDIIGSYPWAIGPILTLLCELSLAGWLVAVGSQLFRMRLSVA